MTLAQAIEKVGVGGKVKKDGNHYEHVVTAVGETMALLKYMGTIGHYEGGLDLTQDGWSPVLPKKRVVLHAWECTDGAIIWVRKGSDHKEYGGAMIADIPNMVFEDGKQVFE